MKNNIRYYLFKFTFSFIFGTVLLMVYTFFLAFLNGGTITISINTYGEMIPEAILICVCFPMVIFSFVHIKNKVLPNIKRGET